MYVQGSKANDSESHTQIPVSLCSVRRSTCTNQSHTAQHLTFLTETKTTDSRAILWISHVYCICARAVWTLPVAVSVKAGEMSALGRRPGSTCCAHCEHHGVGVHGEYVLIRQEPGRRGLQSLRPCRV